MIKAIIFDVGGVLAYDVWEHLLCDPDPASVVSTFNLERDKVWQVGQTLWKDYEHQSTSNPGDKNRYEEEYWGKFKKHFPALQSVTVDALIDMTDHFVRPIKGMTEGEPSLLEKLNTLQSGGEIVLAICSNNNAFWFHRQKTKLHLERFFSEDNIFVSHEAGMSKPNLLGAVVEKLRVQGIESNECVFIDDRPKNIQDAVNLYQMTGILFPTEHRNEGADYVTALLNQKGVRI